MSSISVYFQEAPPKLKKTNVQEIKVEERNPASAFVYIGCVSIACLNKSDLMDDKSKGHFTLLQYSVQQNAAGIYSPG